MEKQLKIYYEYDKEKNYHVLAGRKSQVDIERMLGNFKSDLSRELHHGTMRNKADETATITLMENDLTSNPITLKITTKLTEAELKNHVKEVHSGHLLLLVEYVTPEK